MHSLTKLAAVVAIGGLYLACDFGSSMEEVSARYTEDHSAIVLTEENSEPMEVELSEVMFFDEDGEPISMPGSDELVADQDVAEVCCYDCIILPWGVWCAECDPFGTCGGGTSTGTTGTSTSSSTTMNSSTSSTSSTTTTTTTTTATGGVSAGEEGPGGEEGINPIDF
ncbi:MAG: hypothetical protein AAF799_12040 [Myxococcota bacterium]